MEGTGVEQDTKKAAEFGDVGGFYNLGVEKDTKKAVELYQKAAELGDADSLFILGIYYEDGSGVEQDYKKSSRVLSESLRSWTSKSSLQSWHALWKQ